MKLAFTKMQGAGNDFVVVDAVTQQVSLTAGQIRRLSDRHRGIGCDQVLLVEPPDHPDADFRYRIFNADGTPAGQCGNGARCFGRFVREQRLSPARSLKLQVNDGLMQVELLDDGRIRANLGKPATEPAAVPFSADASADERTLHHALEVDEETIRLGVVSMGNPHAVIEVDSVASAAVERLGRRIEAHPRFPERVNVGFMEVVSEHEVRLRVWERGAGETLACGSGACAAVVQGIRAGQLASAVTVHLPGGKLSVEWQGGPDDDVWLGGPTATVFDGVIRLRT